LNKEPKGNYPLRNIQDEEEEERRGGGGWDGRMGCF